MIWVVLLFVVEFENFDVGVKEVVVFEVVFFVMVDVKEGELEMIDEVIIVLKMDVENRECLVDLVEEL